MKRIKLDLDQEESLLVALLLSDVVPETREVWIDSRVLGIRTAELAARDGVTTTRIDARIRRGDRVLADELRRST
jgi:DNA-directed RNA polymerase specialized sigma24 family protein